MGIPYAAPPCEMWTTRGLSHLNCHVAPFDHSAPHGPGRVPAPLAFLRVTEGEEALNLGGGGWTVDLRGGLIRTALATAFIAGILAASGVTGLLP